jgi:hypothetical protein
MSENKNPAFLQGAENLRLAASMADSPAGPASAPPPARHRPLAQAAQRRTALASRTPGAHTCRQTLKLSFYFDGTGNNRDADLLTYEHSNVARMFLAAAKDNEAEGVYSFYIPGLGTYFKDIGDRGEDGGKAFGSRGEDRIQWALKKLQERRSMAKNLCGIEIAAFGFSRGAATARAFANRIQALCGEGEGGWVLKGTKVRVNIYFLGLWETVASVGLPKSANNQSKLGLIGEVIWGKLGGGGYAPSDHMQNRDVQTIAYGRPGADPAPGHMYSWADGHLNWGGEMAIPPVVSHGVHMMAGHEIRNSFPVDSVCHGGSRAAAFSGEEFVYPGVHSDVGGGYRPGEGGRSRKLGQQLSLITLRVMYEKARVAGVPIRNLLDPLLPSPIRLSFAQALATDPDANHKAAAEYAEMEKLWNAYMDYCGRSGRSLGGWFLAHMRAYYAWRFWNIKVNRSSRDTKTSTPDEKAAKPMEQASQREQAELEREIQREESSAAVKQARNATGEARINVSNAEAKLSNSYFASQGPLAAMTREQARALADDQRLRIDEAKAKLEARKRELGTAQQAQAEAEDPLRKLEARKSTLPSQGTLSRNWREYDDRLYADAQFLSQNKGSRQHLRPHYKALVETWEDEFVNNKGLVDNRVMQFFERYIHDSLADFNHDATLPSDPRVVYVGGDEREMFALRAPGTERTASVAA